jgi:hypothetical protein
MFLRQRQRSAWVTVAPGDRENLQGVRDAVNLTLARSPAGAFFINPG